MIVVVGQAALLRTVHSVDFTRGGLTFTRLASTIVVPWDALNINTPTVREEPPSAPKLVVARPALVERQGITGSSNAVVAEGVSTDFLLGAIRVYVTDRARRAAIGTPAELDRLTVELPAPAPVPLAQRPVREPGVTTTGVLIRVLLIAGAFAVEVSTGNWWLELAARTVTGALLINLGSKVHPITWIRQRAGRQRLPLRGASRGPVLRIGAGLPDQLRSARPRPSGPLCRRPMAATVAAPTNGPANMPIRPIRRGSTSPGRVAG